LPWYVGWVCSVDKEAKVLSVPTCVCLCCCEK
jgi:hypothetical protein